jgi:putative transposase
MCLALEKTGQDAPLLWTVYRFVDRFKADHNDLVVLMREGEKALNDKVSDYIRRDRTVLEVGDTLVADGHVLNFECLHPETGRPFRPVLIAWFDLKSGLVVGWEFMPTESTIGISSALRMAIKNLGRIPKSVYLDNGKAFKGKYFTQTNEGFEILRGLYSRLGIATQFATPYRAQVKPVERFFRTFNEQFSKMVPSYIGRNIEEKPAWRRRDEKFHKSRHERNPAIPTLREAGAAFAAYVSWFAGNMTHPDHQGQTCGEVFLAGRGPGVDLAELDRQFLWTIEVQPFK